MDLSIFESLLEPKLWIFILTIILIKLFVIDKREIK